VGRYVVYMSYYPALKKAETIRLALVILSLLFPFVGALVAGYAYGNIWLVTFGFICGCFGFYFSVRLINKYIKVHCPICGSDKISENYVNSPRGSSSNVEHHCSSCNSKYIDGQHIV